MSNVRNLTDFET